MESKRRVVWCSVAMENYSLGGSRGLLRLLGAFKASLATSLIRGFLREIEDSQGNNAVIRGLSGLLNSFKS